LSKFPDLIEIDNILISDDVIEKQFVCDLLKCKGGCCEEGDAGAPLTDEERVLVEKYYEKIKPYLAQDAIKEIEKKGKYVYDDEFGYVTPTLPSDNEICVYGMRDSKGIIKCAFEQAYYDGLVPWKKPISCHLYPIITRKGKHGDYERVNYEPREKLCKSGCVQGERLKVPAYQFLKEAITRKYGKDFYEALDKIAKDHTSS
jgi:hypothetical protein